MYNCLHLLIPNSQSISPPPTSPLATKSLFSMSVNLFLVCRRVHLYHLLGSTLSDIWFLSFSLTLLLIHSILFILIQTPCLGHTQSITLGMSILFMSIQVYRQPTILLTGEVPWWFLRLSNWLCHCCGIFLACAHPPKKGWSGKYYQCLARRCFCHYPKLVCSYLMSL